MKRQVSKYIEEYNRLFTNTNNDKFFASDVSQFYNIANNSNDMLWDAITSALMFGFIVGMKYQKRQQKKAATKH